MNVLFVCTGNVCRSPMAEGFLNREAAERGLDVEVRSTGTHAWEGRAATFDGRRVMADLGAPIDRHRTLVLSESLVDWAHLVLGLAQEHVRDVVRLRPAAADKTFTLKEFVRLLPSLPARDELGAIVADATLLRAEDGHERAADLDVDDPFGEREEAYRRVAVEIQGLVAELARDLAARLPAERRA